MTWKIEWNISSCFSLAKEDTVNPFKKTLEVNKTKQNKKIVLKLLQLNHFFHLRNYNYKYDNLSQKGICIYNRAVFPEKEWGATTVVLIHWQIADKYSVMCVYIFMGMYANRSIEWSRSFSTVIDKQNKYTKSMNTR